MANSVIGSCDYCFKFYTERRHPFQVAMYVRLHLKYAIMNWLHSIMYHTCWN